MGHWAGTTLLKRLTLTVVFRITEQIEQRQHFVRESDTTNRPVGLRSHDYTVVDREDEKLLGGAMLSRLVLPLLQVVQDTDVVIAR